MQTRLAWIFCFALGLVIADFRPLVPLVPWAYGQRSDDDGDQSREQRAERWRRFRERRENGGEGEGGDRAERWRRFREQRERGDAGSGDGERRSADRADEDRNRDSDNDEDRGRGAERGRRRSGQMDYSEYARNLVRDNDKNGNMILDGDEVKQLRGPAASADANGDKSITVEELVARFSNRGPSEGRRGERNGDESEAASSSESKTTAKSEGAKTRVYTWLGNGPAGKENAEKRKSYRFTSAAERWGSASSRIKSRDRNNDGQVSMSEYSRTWSARTVREFQRYDHDGDGVITPKEATTGGGDE